MLANLYTSKSNIILIQLVSCGETDTGASSQTY
jgi:hypothetical protein